MTAEIAFHNPLVAYATQLCVALCCMSVVSSESAVDSQLLTDTQVTLVVSRHGLYAKVAVHIE